MSEKWSFQNKENADFVNRTSNRKLASSLSKYLQKSQDSDTEQIAFQSGRGDKLTLLLKKQKLRDFITKVLKARRLRDRQDSHKQIFCEVLLFKMFWGWKKLSQKVLKQKVQAQLFRQRRQFHLFSRCFTQWADLIRKPKLQDFKLKKKCFQELKIVCSRELQLRLKRIQLESQLLKRRTKETINYLRWQFEENKVILTKVEKFREKKIKIEIINCWKELTRKDKGQKLRFQQYKLAHLFRTRLLLLKGFKGLKEK